MGTSVGGCLGTVLSRPAIPLGGVHPLPDNRMNRRKCPKAGIQNGILTPEIPEAGCHFSLSGKLTKFFLLQTAYGSLHFIELFASYNAPFLPQQSSLFLVCFNRFWRIAKDFINMCDAGCTVSILWRGLKLLPFSSVPRNLRFLWILPAKGAESAAASGGCRQMEAQ